MEPHQHSARGVPFTHTTNFCNSQQFKHTREEAETEAASGRTFATVVKCRMNAPSSCHQSTNNHVVDHGCVWCSSSLLYVRVWLWKVVRVAVRLCVGARADDVGGWSAQGSGAGLRCRRWRRLRSVECGGSSVTVPPSTASLAAATTFAGPTLLSLCHRPLRRHSPLPLAMQPLTSSTPTTTHNPTATPTPLSLWSS